MKKLKIMTIVGTRPEIIRLSRVLARLDRSEVIKHILVHTGQNYDYELREIFFEDLELRAPDYYLNAAGSTASQTIGQAIANIDPILEKENPDAVLILGDTNSCLCAIPAKKRKIPIFHMEAGNRCFDQRVPEEINRKIVDHISDINMPYSDIAREYLLREGIPADRIIKTGSPMFEVLNYYKSKIERSQILEELCLQEGKYFVISAHREENINSSKFGCFIDMLNYLSNEYQIPIIVSTHPRTRKAIDRNTKQNINGLIRFMKPLNFSDYNKLQINARCVLSDSGTISEESSIMKFPALNIREAHERPEAMEETSVIMTGFNVERINQALCLNNEVQCIVNRIMLDVNDYSKPNVSEKVVRIILAHIDYVNRVVWSK